MNTSKKPGLAIIEALKTLLNSEDFKNQHRLKKKDFTRRRKLPFPVLIGFLLNMLTKTLQIELDRFFQVLRGLVRSEPGEQEEQGAPSDAETVSKQAFSKARMKVSEQAFIQLNTRLVDECYTDNTYKTWKGYRVLGIDGSTVQLPMTDEILKEFGAVTNQYGPVMAMGRISVMYDVENDLSVDALIDKYTAAERDLAVQHLQALAAFDVRAEGHQGHENDLLLYDMGYPALWFMAYLRVMNKEYVIRTSEAFLAEVQEAIHSEQTDVVIQIPVQTPDRPLSEKIKQLIPEIDPEMVLTVRVVKLVLDDGLQEFLLTSLLDTERFPRSDFQGLYAKRWGSETNYDVFKNILEIENMTGKSALSVRQDFHATVFTQNIRGLIQWDLQEEIERENQSTSRKYAYKLNTNLCIGRLKDTIVTLVLGQGDLSACYSQLTRQFKRNMLPIRPGRHFPRKRKNHQKYTMTKRRAL